MAVAVAVGAALAAGLAPIGPVGPGIATGEPVDIVNAPPGGGETVEETVLWGPIDLAAMGDPGWQEMYDGPVPRPAGAFGLKSITFDIVDEHGTSLPKHDVHMHHFVIGTAFQQDPACPERTALDIEVKPLVGTGSERTPIAFPDPYAVLVGEEDIWGATSHLMNMTDTPKTIYVKYTVGVQRGATAENTRNLTPYWADWDGCLSGHTMDLPGGGDPGSLVTHSSDWTMPADGIVVGVGGHIHDGGIDMLVHHEDGSLICRSPGVYVEGMGGHGGHGVRSMGPGPGMVLDSVTPCLIHDSVAAGERLRVSGNYDGEHAWDAVMGMAVLFVWFGAQGDPPPPSTTTAPTTTAPAALVVTPTFAG